MIYFFVAALLVLADQLVKLAIRSAFALGESTTLIPGVLGLTYVQNTGMAFSSLSSQTFFLTVVSLAASVAIGVALAKNLLFSHPWKVAADPDFRRSGGQPHRPGVFGLRHRHDSSAVCQLRRF